MVKSARRALEILERFEALQRPASVGEIATELGYPVSSTSVLLRTMEELGYLSYDAHSRQFAPTVRVGFMGDWILNGHPGRARLKSLLHDARRLTAMTALLATRNGLDAQYLFVLRTQEMNFESRRPDMGTIRSILTASPGIMLLAELPDAQIELIVRGVKATQRTSASLEQVMNSVDDARRLGYAWNVGKARTDVPGVACPHRRRPAPAGQPFPPSASGPVRGRDAPVAPASDLKTPPASLTSVKPFVGPCDRVIPYTGSGSPTWNTPPPPPKSSTRSPMPRWRG